MKIKATDKFSQISSANNYGGFGKTVYTELESGKVVDCNSDCTQLIEDGYVEEVKSKKKESK